MRGALITKREELLNGVPEWITNGNLYSIEFSLLNTVILGMSATQYRKEHNISSNEQIRNYFSEDQLDDMMHNLLFLRKYILMKKENKYCKQNTIM